MEDYKADCRSCRHHSCEKKEVPQGILMDSIVEFEDKLVYSCKAPLGPHAGQEVGIEPVHCASYQRGAASDPVVLDEMEARLRARWANRQQTWKNEE